MNSMFVEGFSRTAIAHGYDPQSLMKFAQEIEVAPTRDLPRSERKALLAALPENRKKQILKFLLEELSDGGDKKYIVKARDNDKSKGEYTYIPAKDSLFETPRQVERNERAKYNRSAWGRAWLLGCL